MSGQKIYPFFSVFKIKTDIKILYDGTGSGLDNSLLSPSFILPTIDSLLRKMVLDP